MKILLAIDSSSASQNVIAEAATRPWPSGTRFCVLHIVDVLGIGRSLAMIDEEKRYGQTLVAAAAEKLIRAGRETSPDILVGFPRKAVVQYAKEWGADFVMVGSHGQGALSRFLLGSVAQAVLRTAPCSVEVVRRGIPESSSHRGMKILLGTDGSDGAAVAAKSVANRPWPAGSQVKIISAVQLLVPGNELMMSSSSAIYPTSLLEEVWNEVRSSAHEAVAEARKTLEAAGMKILAGETTPDGDPRAVLLAQAKEWDADLIVLGSYGRRGMDRILMGSVSESVALHAHCSVEVIRG
ncbi:MAG TPA: universal stress protein [Candidatus Acidoferrales bacterium]|nr:universal stress protein [Candidatus Acidoferrales bacterium]